MSKMVNQTKQKRDLPKSVVVILVILAVVISVLGTWSVMQGLDDANAVPVSSEDSANGKVAVTVMEPPEPQVSESHGSVSLQIEDPKLVEDQ